MTEHEQRLQAKTYLREGSLCRAAATAKQLVDRSPSAKNVELLADIYLEQGLHDDAIKLYAVALQPAWGKPWIN